MRQLTEEETIRTAREFAALGHPVRLGILDVLSRAGGEASMGEVECCFTLGQPTISHHFKILRDARLIASEQRGVCVYHTVCCDALTDLQRFLEALKG